MSFESQDLKHAEGPPLITLSYLSTYEREGAQGEYLKGLLRTRVRPEPSQALVQPTPRSS